MAGAAPAQHLSSNRDPRQVPVPGLPESLLRRYRAVTLAQMQRCLEERHLPLYDIMRYHLGLADRRGGPSVGRGGKMLRPALCLLCCEAVGGDYRKAAPAAAAVELLHNFTLIHDDIEDASSSRHGRDTVWRVWGQPQAINAGDGMYALAHLALGGLSEVRVPPDAALQATRLLDGACLSLCEGQYLDLAFEERAEVSCDEYLQMVSGKTGALLGAAAALGALLGGASEEAVHAFDRFGQRLGLAFQVYDDLLGVWGNAEKMGKPAADILARKKSFPVVFALEQASESDRHALRRAYARLSPSPADTERVVAVLERAGARQAGQRAAVQFRDEALAALAGLTLVPARRRNLEALASYMVQRGY